MMNLTPSAKSSFIAGIGLWAVLWSALAKLDTIAKLFRVRRIVTRKRTWDWMQDNKVLTLLFTEGLNYGLHGVSRPDSVTFALGGTVMNIFMIFIVLPLRKLITGRRGRKAILSGAA